MRVHVDFETQSEIDLKKVGAAIYSEHPSTQIMCLGFAVDDSIVIQCGVMELANRVAWKRKRLWELAADPTVIFVAHNAAFEQWIWENIMVKRYGFPRIPANRWRCTMVKALYHGLPPSLEGAGAALRLPIQKDKEAAKALLMLCKPNKNGHFWTYAEQPEAYNIVYAYNVRDIETERLLDKTLRDIDPNEQRVWEIDQRINQTGIRLDIPAIQKAIEINEKHKVNLDAAFRAATKGSLANPRQRAKLQVWLQENGVAVDNTQKATLTRMLARTEVPDHVRDAIHTALEANKASIAKYRAMIQRSKNGVLREILQFYGAHTGRWAGRGVQLQNLKRPDGSLGIGTCIQWLTAGDYDLFSMFYSNVSEALSSLLRAMIIAAPGKTLFMADFAQIEARVLAWLANELGVLDLFRAYDAGTGPDIYCGAARDIYGYEVTKRMAERQVGKIAILALGYGGGIGAFAKMARGSGVDLESVYDGLWESASENERERADWSVDFHAKNNPDEPVSLKVGRASDIIKQRWRAANPAIVEFWADLESAAIEAVRTGRPVQVGRLVWFMHDRYLWCKLPAGRCMAYPYPKVTQDSKGKSTLTYMGVYQNKWLRMDTYGGKLAENVVQAVARDLLAEAMVRVEDVYPVSFHVHDEMISEVPATANIDHYVELMAKAPAWADGLPIGVDGHAGQRFGKAA